MRLLAPDLSEDTKREIESAIRDPADKALQMLGLVTTSLPDAANSKSVFGWIFDTTAGYPKFSDGTNWLTFSLSDHTHTSFGALTITGLVTLTGGQIKFPATQVPSADANTLDDYEEGTWTPTLQFGGAATGITYGTRNGRYTKVGRLVFVELRIVLTSKGSSTGAATITGLPFTNNGSCSAVGSGTFGGMSGVLNDTTGVIYPSGTTININDNGGGSRANLTDSNFTNTSDFDISITYTV